MNIWNVARIESMTGMLLSAAGLLLGICGVVAVIYLRWWRRESLRPTHAAGLLSFSLALAIAALGKLLGLSVGARRSLLFIVLFLMAIGGIMILVGLACSLRKS